MKLKLTLASALLAFSLAQSAFASEKEALAEQYVNLPEVQLMVDDMFSPQSMANQIAASLPPGFSLSDNQMQRIGVLLSEAVSGLRPKITQQMIESSARVFTTEELKALLDFYSSEHGAAVMSKMHTFMQETMGALSADIQQVTQQVAPEMTKIMMEGN